MEKKTIIKHARSILVVATVIMTIVAFSVARLILGTVCDTMMAESAAYNVAGLCGMVTFFAVLLKEIKL